MSPEQPLFEPIDTAEDEQRRPQRRRAVWLGVGVANLCGVVMALLNMALQSKSLGGGGGLYIASDFTLIPLVMGIVGEFYWRSTYPSGRRRFGLAAQTAAVAMVLAAVLFAGRRDLPADGGSAPDLDRLDRGHDRRLDVFQGR